MCTHTHTHTHTDARQTHTLIHTQTHACTRTLSLMHTQTRTDTNAYTHAPIHSHTHALMHGTHTRTDTRTHAPIHTHQHSPTQTHQHKDTHTGSHTLEINGHAELSPLPAWVSGCLSAGSLAGGAGERGDECPHEGMPTAAWGAFSVFVFSLANHTGRVPTGALGGVEAPLSCSRFPERLRSR